MMSVRALAMLVALTAMLAAPAWAAPGDAEKGAVVYAKRCLQCHGEEGDGLGPAAERLNPPPRDFTLGQFKIKTTPFDEDFANDDDVFRMIRDGMPGTAMPGWADMLSDQDMWDLVAHLKTFAGTEEEKPGKQLDYGIQVKSSPESIARGKELFLDGERCSECHGTDGKGDAIKRLKDDNGERTWPRNLTKPWTFRASNDPKDIFARISVGIPTTQMPSFADPKSKKKLSIEDRWNVANYVASLAKTVEVVRPENTVVKALRVDGEVPAAPDDAAWALAEPSTFFLVPQIIGKERFFTPANDSITVRATYNDDAIGLLLEWDDRTRSIPGDAKAESIADADMGEDAVAVQFPVVLPKGMEKPYFLMGDAAKPVTLWRWHGGTTEAGEGVQLITATGIDKHEERDAVRLAAKGVYKDGTWRVVMMRARTPADTAKDIAFTEGSFIPIAFANWDGSNAEKGTHHTVTTWYWLQLKPPTGSRPLLAALAAMLLVGGVLVWWGRGAARRREEDEA